MGKECVKCDTEGFAAADDAKCVVRDDEECRCVALKTACENGKDGEEDAADDLERDL